MKRRPGIDTERDRSRERRFINLISSVSFRIGTANLLLLRYRVNSAWLVLGGGLVGAAWWTLKHGP